MEQKEKQELIKTLTNYIEMLKDSYSKELNNAKCFNTFCYYDPSDSKAHLCEELFDHFFDDNIPSQDLNTNGLLKGNFDKKTLTKALNITIQDKRVIFEISNALINHKRINQKDYVLPKNGITFLEVLKKLYGELKIIKNNKNINIFEKGRKESNVKAIIKLMKNAILKEYQIINISLNYLTKAINIFDEMILLLQEDKYMIFNKDKHKVVYEFLSLSEDEKNSISKVLDYNNKLRINAINNSENYERLDTPEYKLILKNMVNEMEDRSKRFDEYFNHINSIYDGNDETLKRSLRTAKKNNNITDDIRYIFTVMLKEDPEYKVFSNAIIDTIGIVTPNTKRVIKEPQNLDGILEILDCYDEVLSNETKSSLNVKKVEVILNEIASEIIDVYNKCTITSSKVNTSLVELKNIYSSLKSKKKISLINEKAYIESALGIEDDDEEEMRFYVLSQIRSIKEYNRSYDLKKLRANARRKRTEVYKKLEEEGIEMASISLRANVEKNKTNKELLVLIEHMLDEGIEKYNGDDVNYYHDLCYLAMDCTRYIKDVTGMAFSDGDDLREEIKQLDCA